MRYILRFLNVKNFKPVEIHRQLGEIYGDSVMTDGMVRNWVREAIQQWTN